MTSIQSRLLRCLVVVFFCFANLAHAGMLTYLIEAEDFQFHGDWRVQSDHGASGRILQTIHAESDAITVITLPQDETYNFYLRSRDFPEQMPGSRRFKLVVDGQPLPKEAGAHGHDGYYWERVGTLHLKAGDHVLAIRDTSHYYPRCDAILISAEDINPNTLTLSELTRLRLQPKEVQAYHLRDFPRNPAIAALAPDEGIVISNEYLRLGFLSGTDTTGKPVVTRTMAVRGDDEWRDVPIDPATERLFVLYAPESNIITAYFPLWPGGLDRLKFSFGSQTYETSGSKQNPFWAAQPRMLTPRRARAIDASTIEVIYETNAGRKVKGQWSLNNAHVTFELEYQAERAGEYSIGFSAFGGRERSKIESVLLSPHFNFQRLSNEPKLTTDAVSPHAFALVQPLVEDGHPNITIGLAADPSCLPMEWPQPDNADYGFALISPEGLVQPSVFQPVLGMPGSRLEKGQKLIVKWHILALSGDWRDAMAYASNHIMHVTDYRQPWRCSLTDAALNMIDLIKDDQAGGWDANLKGFYNIEAPGVVTQAAPLSVISAALLAGDEHLWAERALPTLAFTLSRRGAHFASALPEIRQSYVNERSLELTVPGDYYMAAYWQGVHALLGEANPWIADLVLPDGPNGRVRAQRSRMFPLWAELLAAYRLNPTSERLEETCRQAEAWIDKEFNRPKTDLLPQSAFYNIDFYPLWWDLIDLYEETQNIKYLKAAEEGAFHTMAGQWSHPRIDEAITVHPGSQFEGTGHIWWRGTEKYRLGFPRKPGDAPERNVPGWVVSNIGLTFEQPSTYYGGGNGPFGMIMMCNFGPHLLRMYGHTGRDIYRIYARNAIVGRWANYPGYYQRGYTDLIQNPRYPYQGPDVTSIYYHHIPAHLMFTLDWLVTDIEVRSKGRIRFPYVSQHGYVWFSNRIYGTSASLLGQVFDDHGVQLGLDRSHVRVASKDINHIIARSSDHLWVILTNDAKREAMTTLTVDVAKLNLKTNTMVVFIDAEGVKRGEKPLAPALDVSIPKGGLLAVRYEAEYSDVGASIPPLREGRIEQKLPAPWQSVHAFRIRSPFGKDGIYVVLTGKPENGVSATLALNGEVVTDKSFPYEFVVYPVAMEEDAELTLTLREANGRTTKVEKMKFHGTGTDIKGGQQNEKNNTHSAN